MGGVVACPEPDAAQIGRDVFGRGGDALAAAVAGAFAQGVTNPLGCGIGGSAFILVFRPGWNEPRYYNAQAAVGSMAHPEVFSREFIAGSSERLGRFLVQGDQNNMGYRSIMTPGFVRGMEALLAVSGGSVTWSQLVEPAAVVAVEGFEMYPYLRTYFTFEGADRPGFPGIFRKIVDPAVRERFLPGGEIPDLGHVMVQPDYGRTLQNISRQGADEFYVGGLGKEIADDLAENRSFVTARDLAEYQVKPARPVKGYFRGLTVYSSPPPSHGIILLTMLGLAEHFNLKRQEWNSPDYLELVSWITRTAFSSTMSLIGDPDFVGVPVEWLVSKGRVAQVKHGGGLTSSRSTLGSFSDHTTHISAADTAGNFVSLTHSIGSVAGAGVMTPDLGFFYNNFMGTLNPLHGYHNSIVPGKRMGGGCPSIVFRDGHPWFAIGSSGGSRLISAVFQTILNVVIFGMSLQQGVTAPRVHSETGRTIYIEPAFGEACMRELSRRGYEVEVTEYMGCNQAAGLFSGRLEGGSDPRGGQEIGFWEVDN